MKEKEDIMVEKKELVEVQGKMPSQMIQLAIDKGADLDKLEKLLILQEKWERNEARKAYHVAMAEFKTNATKAISKDKPVDYTTKTGARVKYRHATLSNIVETITPELSKHGFSVSWPPKQEPGLITITCKVTHRQGHSEEFSLSAPADDSGGKNTIQALGSTTAYLQRYTLLCAIGLATKDQDDDGKASTIEVIDEKQLNQVLDFIADKNVDITRFCKAFGITKVEDLPKKRYDEAIKALQKKVKK